MAIQFRETRARFRERARFLGLDASPVPIVLAAIVSIFFLTVSSVNNPGMNIWLRALICGFPFCLTVGYIWVFKTGRRPSLDRDLFMLVMNGNAASPSLPAKQPVHPGLRFVSRDRRIRRPPSGAIYVRKSAK